MKKQIIVAIFLCSAYLAQALDANISLATFKSPTQGGYVEVYLHLAGKTLQALPIQDSLLQASAEIILIFKQNNQIIKFDKYTLDSPISKVPLDFVDAKRYALADGAYELSVEVKDVHRPEDVKTYQTNFVIEYAADKLCQSDIQLLATFKKAEEGTNNPFVKNGIVLEPLPHHFYDKNASLLSFYNEIYHADKILAEDFMVSYSIQKIENNTSQTVAIGHKRLSPQPIIPLLVQMNISQLESGNYILNVEIRNRSKQVLSTKSIAFQRSNPYLQKDHLALANANLSEEFVQKLTPEELEFSLRALTPRLPNGDVDLVNTYLNNKNLEAQRLYLFSFWAQQNPNQPEFAFLKYNEVAKAVDEKFKSGFRYGFETDRGYVYLKYGQPNDIDVQEEEPSAPPYEIWTYYEFPATRQNNVKFIFYNPSLAPGDFQLLHSTAIGELNNPQWELELYRNAPNEVDGPAFHSTQMKDNFNRNARRIFRDN